jgi:hypothetical protein
VDWAKYYKNVSIFVAEISAEYNYATGEIVGEISKHLLCKLEDGVFFPNSLTMMMFHGDPLMRRVNPLNTALNLICYLLVLLANHFLHISRIRVKSLTLRLLMSYIYDISRLRVKGL